MNNQVALEPSFVAALPGCVSDGDNKDKAIKNIQAAIALYLDLLQTITALCRKPGILILRYEQDARPELRCRYQGAKTRWLGCGQTTRQSYKAAKAYRR